MSDLFDRTVVPLASESDALATVRALRPHRQASESVVTLVHVVEKVGGAPDKASVEQREEHAEEVLDVALDALVGDDVSVESQIRYHTDVATAILDAVADYDTVSVGATRTGAVSQALFGSIPRAIGERSDGTVVMARNASQTPRSVRDAIVHRLSE